uniref:Uncharacterized protein n=1 Tax=Anguilla anguilla TaxID=7936 RepID=A0A0E9WBD7_ANGAN
MVLPSTGHMSCARRTKQSREPVGDIKVATMLIMHKFHSISIKQFYVHKFVPINTLS